MNPLFFAVPIALVVSYFIFKKPAMTLEERAAAMVRFADALYKVIAKIGTPVERGVAAEEAARLAKDAFGLTKTEAGIRSGLGLPVDEKWPGLDISVAAYMNDYVNRRKPVPVVPGQPAKPKYSDETPVAPYEDPRAVRAKALSLESQGKTLEAKVYHAKADNLNKLIKATKAKNSVVSTTKGLLQAARDFGKVKT